MKNKIFLVLFFTFIAGNIQAQEKTLVNHFYFSSGPGLVYSFFKSEAIPFPLQNLAEFNSKKSLGRIFDFETGYYIGKKYNLSLRYSYHIFSNKFDVFDTLANTNYEYTLSGKLYRRQHYIQLLLNRIFFEKQNNALGVGTGILLVNESDQFFSAYSGVPNLSNPAVSLHEYPHWEFGSPLILFFEKKLNKHVTLGAKAQAYIIISVGSFESVSINPYLKVNFLK